MKYDIFSKDHDLCNIDHVIQTNIINKHDKSIDLVSVTIIMNIHENNITHLF